MVSSKLYGRMVTALKLFFATIAVLCVVAAAPAMAAGKRVALIIGNSNYVNGTFLPNPGNDADKIAQAARQAGFVVTEAKDQGLAQFKSALKAFRDQAVGAEIAFVYYAGHGIEKDNANYLIPVDAKLAEPGDLLDEGISLAYVTEKLSGAERSVILLDACRENPFKNAWSEKFRSFFRNGLGEINPPDNSLVLFATQAGMKTPDGEAGGNSNFAIAVAEELVKPGVEIHDFGPAVMDNVKRRTNGLQKPLYSPTLDSTKVYFIAPAMQASDARTQDENDWTNAKVANTRASYQAYKRAHQGGKYFEAANERLEDFLVGQAIKAPLPPVAYVPPTNPPVVASPTSQNPVDTPAPPVVTAPPVTAPVPTGYVLPPAPAIIVGPVVQNPEPAPAPAPAPPVAAIVISPPKDTSLTVSPSPVVAQPMAQSATYVAPPIARQYGNGGFPVMPEPPQFALGPYPTCKDNWQSVVDPSSKAYATNECKSLFSAYKTNWLNKYRVVMNDYSAMIGDIYTKEVQPPNYPKRELEVQQFYNEMRRRSDGVLDRGYLMAEYEQGLAKFNADFAVVVESYDIATGCHGHPTPAGLAPNLNCPK